MPGIILPPSETVCGNACYFLRCQPRNPHVLVSEQRREFLFALAFVAGAVVVRSPALLAYTTVCDLKPFGLFAGLPFETGERRVSRNGSCAVP